MTFPPAGSYWLASAPPEAPPLMADLPDVDVAVLGGGITGITTAYLLKRAGRTVALVEARRLLGGVTGHTTAKVTAQHGLIYADLRRRFGAETTAGYAASQLAALDWIRAEAAALGVDCELSTRASYVYAETPDRREELRREAGAAAEAGLDASYVDELDLPYRVAGAVRVAGQAQFHPVRWLAALAAEIPGEGSYVLEGARALDVRDTTVATERGTLRARDVVVATTLRSWTAGSSSPGCGRCATSWWPARCPPTGHRAGCTCRSTRGTAQRRVRWRHFPRIWENDRHFQQGRFTLRVRLHTLSNDRPRCRLRPVG